MIRNILAVLAGVVVGGIIIGIGEGLGHLLLPLPEGLEFDPSDPDAYRAALAQIPDINRLAVVGAWGAGALVAGFVTAFIARRWHVTLALVAGGGLLFAGLTNLILIPSPFWMWVFGLVIFLPAAWLGAKLAPKRTG